MNKLFATVLLGNALFLSMMAAPLIENTNFEKKSGRIYAWKLKRNSSAQKDHSLLRSENNTLIFQLNSPDSAMFLVQPKISFSSECAYKICWQAKRTGNGELNLYVEWVDKNGKFHKKGASKELTGNWEKYTFQFNIQEKEFKAAPYFVIKAAKEGSVFLKEFKIEEVDIANIAGMLKTSSIKYEAMPTKANFSGIAQKPASPDFPQTNQLNNSAPLLPLKFRSTAEIKADSTCGGAVAWDELLAKRNDPQPFKWSVEWVVTDRNRDFTIKDSARCYSSRQWNIQKEKPEYFGWVEVSWTTPQRISKIELVPRKSDMVNFPAEFSLEISSDGNFWEHLVTAKKQQGNYAIQFSERMIQKIRLKALKLDPEAPNGHIGYMQIRTIAAYDNAGNNLALKSHGASASSSDPHMLEMLDFERICNTFIQGGMKWLLFDLTTTIPQEYLPMVRMTLQHLKKNGVSIILRCSPRRWDRRKKENWLARPNILPGQVREILEPLKDLVSVVALCNEENMYGSLEEMFSRTEIEQIYVASIKNAAKNVREIAPHAKIEIESALFDFGWTDDILKMGLADVIDIFSVHIYREADFDHYHPEMASTFIHNGRRGFPDERKYFSNEEEISAFQALLKRHNPKIQMAVTETGIRTSPYKQGMSSTEIGQAKALARQYICHSWHGIKSTCWWTVFPSTIPFNIRWGLVACDGRRLPAWNAMRNVAALFDFSWAPDLQTHLTAAPNIPEFFYHAFRRGKERMVAYWATVPARDENTGKITTLTIEGSHPKSVEAADMLTGTIQKINFEWSNNKIVLPDMVLRDYPVVLVIR